MHVNNLYALVCKIYLAVRLKYFWYLILALLCVLEFATSRNTTKPSAGVSLTYYHTGGSALSIENLTTNFLETPFTVNTNHTYRKTGFLPYVSLSETFTNKYTSMSGEKLQIRAMQVEYIYIATGLTKIKAGTVMNLKDIKYSKLFANGATYCLASAYSSKNLWDMYYNGNYKYRSSSRSFFILYSQSI